MLERKEADMNDAHVEFELDSDNDTQIKTKIEPTKAEEEAFARGLQTIKNDDLEEVRELGSVTYGVVYHGKCNGSALGIKRIKASCFAGNPSGDSAFDRLSTNIRSVQSTARKSRLQNSERRL